MSILETFEKVGNQLMRVAIAATNGVLHVMTPAGTSLSTDGGAPKSWTKIAPDNGNDLTRVYRAFRIGVANPASPGTTGTIKADVVNAGGTTDSNQTITVTDCEVLPGGAGIKRIYVTGTTPSEIWGLE